MDFPLRSALLLLQFARGKQPLDEAVIAAAIELLQYGWRKLTDSVLPKGDVPGDATPDQLLEALLADHLDDEKWKVELADADLRPTLSSADKAVIEGELAESEREPVEFTPAVWVTLGLWLLEIVAKKWLERK